MAFKFNPFTGKLDIVIDSLSDLTTKDHDLLTGLLDDDHTQYLLANGTRALTGNWDAGSFQIRAAALLVDTVDGVDITPGSDTNTDLVTLNVTGTPKISWHEVDDLFDVSKPVRTGGSQTGMSQTAMGLTVNNNMGSTANDDFIAKTLNASDAFVVDASADQILENVDQVIKNGKNIILDTGTGTKIGTATNQKLGLFNATPVIQAVATTDLGVVLSDVGARAAGTAYPITTSGTITLTGAMIGKITTVTNTYTVLSNDQTVIGNKVTDFTITLPTAVVGQKFDIKNINTGIITIDGAGSDTIDGELTQIINQWENITIQCISANTWIIK